MAGIRTIAATAAAVALAGCAGGPDFGIGALTSGCKPLDPETFETVDWTQVRQVNLRIRHGEYTPSLVRLYQDKAYVIRVENRDDTTRRFQAGALFQNLKVHSIESAQRTFEAGCPSGFAIQPRETVEIRFIAARDGRYEFDDAAVPLPFATAPSGVILVEVAPPVTALLQAPVIAPPDIPTTPYQTTPESAVPPAATPAAVTPPGVSPVPVAPIAPAAPVEIQKAPSDPAPAVPGESSPADGPAAPQGGLPMIPAPEPAPAAPGAAPAPDATTAPKEQPPGLLEMIRPAPREEKDSAVPSEGGLPMFPPPAMPPRTPPAEAMPELPPGVAPADEPKPAEKSEDAPLPSAPLPAPKEAAESPQEEELPAMTATGPGSAPAEVLPPTQSKAENAGPAAPPVAEEKKVSSALRPDVAEAPRPPSRSNGPFSRFLGRVGALYGD